MGFVLQYLKKHELWKLKKHLKLLVADDYSFTHCIKKVDIEVAHWYSKNFYLLHWRTMD
mgnify:CR=1 FL=1